MRYTLPDLLARAAERWPDRVAVHIHGQEPVTYRDLRRAAESVASSLRRHHPQARHVAVALPNATEFVVALYGAALAGRTAVLLNPRLTDAELTYQIEQSDAGVLIAGDAPRRPLASLLRALPEGLPVVWCGLDPPAGVRWSDWLCPSTAGGRVAGGPDDPAVIIYTSGSTARPKGVMLSHRSIVHNAEMVGVRFGVTEQDKVFCAGPFFHSGGVSMHILLSACYGAAAHSVPAFDPAAVVDIVRRERITLYSGIETLFLRLADAPGFSPAELASVRTGWTTGTPAVLHTIAERIGIPGVVGVYGISEASPNVTMSHWKDNPAHRLDTIGRPQEDTEVRVVDPATGQDVPAGTTGELLVRGPGLMLGYYRKPAETATALRDGWLHTGDLAERRPDGYLTFAGRMKDTVRTDGENVSCAEVEDALYALGNVELAAVFGVADTVRGEIVVAAVRPSGAWDETRALTELRTKLAGYKVPRHIVVVDEFPFTASGKLHKRKLHDSVAVQLGRQ